MGDGDEAKDGIHTKQRRVGPDGWETRKAQRVRWSKPIDGGCACDKRQREIRGFRGKIEGTTDLIQRKHHLQTI